MEDFYDLLGVSEDASTEEIDRAWRERVRTYHPDVNDDARANAQFKTLKAAHEVLSAEKKRAAYDRMGHEAYVRERLGGLPTAGQPGPNAVAGGADGADGDDTDESSGSGGGSRTESARSTGATGSRTGSNRTGRTRGTSRQSRQANQQARSDGRSRSADSGRQAASTGSAAGRDAAEAAGGATDRRTATSTPSATSTSYRGLTRLQYGWLGVLFAGVVYLAGLWQYLGANVAAVGALREAVAADPLGALTATRLIAPGTFALGAASGGADPGLLFPVGAVALAVAFLAVVLSVGRGSAYLYLLGGLAPVVGLAVGPVVALPDGAVLLLVAAIPVGATVLFVVDVGRYAA